MRYSITFKLLSLIIVSFLITTIGVLLIGNIQLTRIIDESQKAVFAEKIETIWGTLRRSNDRLRRTGLVEAYEDDFKEATLKTLRETYYRVDTQEIYPFILDTEGRIVMHPVLPPGDLSLEGSDLARKMISGSEGDFEYTYLGRKRWCLFSQYPDWGWVIGYTVPLETKYADAREFSTLLVYTMGGLTLLVLLILSLIVRRFTRPITTLTNISMAMARGEHDQPIALGGMDEVGILARSFSHMRDAIQRTISELERENTERRKAEEQLLRNEEELLQNNEYIKSILESVTHPLYVIDIHDYTIKMANSASGCKGSEQSTCYAVTHGGDSPCQDPDHLCPLETIKQTQKPTMVEHIHLDGNGNERNIEVYAYPVFDREGRLVQMIEYGIDITERKRAQIDLAAEKERLTVTLRSIGDGVITTDISGNVVLLNRVAETLMGLNSEEASGRPLEEVFHVIDSRTRERCESPAEMVVKGGQTISTSNKILVTRDGREIDITDSGAPILDSEGRIVGVVLVFRDITSQIKMETELLKVKKLESVGVLAGGIAHDFNNILSAILGNINLALFDPTLMEKTRDLLAEAEKASCRAQDLTQQLLTFSKGGDPVKETSSLEGVIRDSADFILHGHKVACRYNIPEELWLVDIDRGQISQVIQNTVLNASDAMPQGGLVDVKCSNLSSLSQEALPFAKEGRYIKISIQDHGTGMPANMVEKIFDPYFSTKHEGSGLGLAIAQSIIHKHNGYITVVSTPGVGTTFSIYLPASDTDQPLLTESSEGCKPSTSRRILIMDDEEMVRKIVQKMLVQLGHEVVPSADGVEALQLYREAVSSEEPFDLVIMDLTVPGGMGGEEAVQEILRLRPGAKVIVSSGYSNDPIMSNFMKYGFCSAIVKPFRLQNLSAAIRQALDSGEKDLSP